jgi:hypothetical protein
MSDEEREHGSFAEGESDPDQYPEDKNVGDFGEGQESEHDEHVGTFAEGEAEDDPEEHREGSFGDEDQ